MAGRPDQAVTNAALRRLTPEAHRIRDALDQDPRLTCEAAQAELAALAREDIELLDRAHVRHALLEQDGGYPARDAELRKLQAARQLVRETIMEVGRSALQGPEADALLLTVQAELWSARTGIGSAGEVLRPLPRPRGGRKVSNLQTARRLGHAIGVLRAAEKLPLGPDRERLTEHARSVAGDDFEWIRKGVSQGDTYDDPLEEIIQRLRPEIARFMPQFLARQMEVEQEVASAYARNPSLVMYAIGGRS